ncbi:MAG: methyltransferase domain-containing protein [Deltaproteobacteria bacterium]|nr:methyltransferase domain-containing protein [Deltaproteobacteria bacterium]
MGYVFDFHDATTYDKCLKKDQNRHTLDLECKLMVDMLKPLPGETILDIGCGTGESLLPFVRMGLNITGLDASPYMLDIALEKIQNRAAFHRGYAEDLPFDDNSFNHACMFTTLEFVDQPQKAIEEACRVAKDRLFIGFLNSFAIKGIQRRIKGIFSDTIYNKARFFSIWKIRQLVRSVVGDVPLSWRTVCCIPGNPNRLAGKLETSELIQRFPFGAFAGVLVTLVPRYRTIPMTLKYRTKKSPGAMTGFAGNVRFEDSDQQHGSLSIRKTG